MKVLITGSEGFMGKNLRSNILNYKDIEIITFSRENDINELEAKISSSDFICHFAGTNRSENGEDFYNNNTSLTKKISLIVDNVLRKKSVKIPILFTSSTQAGEDSFYGKSKLEAELVLKNLSKRTGIPVHIFRLPNVFGKFGKPDYNSVVATFCYNISRGKPIRINNPSSYLNLVYIDDVIAQFIQIIKGNSSKKNKFGFEEIGPQYSITVGDLAATISSFKEKKSTLVIDRVGKGLTRALYSSYVSYLGQNNIVHDLKNNSDDRGSFVEILKTEDSGQFSYFSAKPGVTRGGHFHNSKVERFLVVRGNAKFRFVKLFTGEKFEIFTSGENPQIVETVPGWIHDITNIGEHGMDVFLWANEVFDPCVPDTFPIKIKDHDEEA